MSRTSCRIHGDRWTIKLISINEMKKRSGDRESLGLCDIDTKTIYLVTAGMKSSIIRHELTHAYLSYCYLHDAVIDQYNFEEIVCGLIGDKGEELVKEGNKIFRALRKAI